MNINYDIWKKISKLEYLKFRFIILFLLALTFSVTAQNWNAFNKEYRYNYIYDYNALVTNVLFTDSVKTIGSDTIYYMNRIGVECSGSCPTITTAITTTATVIVPNMPQFLQKTIIKTANGIIQLKDTGNWVIKPTCTLTETWMFDSVSSKTAQCVNISTLTIFSVVDSVKTIIADGTDTILLSKQFGLIQFPNMYGKNKYYRLTGIENASSYDQTALYGYKVPNAWDFYNYDIGDKFCRQGSNQWVAGASNAGGSSWNRETIILNKTFQPGVGFSYTVTENQQTSSWTLTNAGTTSSSSFTSTTSVLNYTLNSKLTENVMYPGQIIQYLPNFQPNDHINIIKYGTDNYGKFYKYHGPPCNTYTNAALPNANTYISFKKNSGYLVPDSYPYTGCFGVNLGVVGYYLSTFASWGRECMTCAVKGGTLYLGAETNLVGISENKLLEKNIFIYPNPTSQNITIESNGMTFDLIEVCNVLGQKILSKELENLTKSELILTELNAGIYFLKVYSKGKQIKVEKIIKE